MRPGSESAAKRPAGLPERSFFGQSTVNHRRPAEAGPLRTASADGRYPELDCVRHLLSPRILDWAEQRAERLGIGADRALISAGCLDEDSYVRALAAALSIAFEPLDTVPRSRCPLGDDELIGKAASGLLPIMDGAGGGTTIILAPRGTGARGLTRLVASDPASAARFRLTTTPRFNRFVLRVGRNAFVRQATDGLKRRWPALSAASHRGVSLSAAAVAAVLVVTGIMAGMLAPLVSLAIVELALSAVFLALLGLRLIGAFIGPPPPSTGRPLSDRDLPVYSVIAAVYREASSVGGLLAAIARLDYPALGSKCTKAIVAV